MMEMGVMCANLDPDRDAIPGFIVDSLGKVVKKLGLQPDYAMIKTDEDERYEAALDGVGLSVERADYILRNNVFYVYG